MGIMIDEIHSKIQIAASLRAETLVPNLMQILGYRQRVAEEMLRCNPDRFEEHKELFNYVNDQIKKLLAI